MSAVMSMLRAYRGPSLERRLKAVYWWCYMQSPRPLSVTDILNYMPTDESIAAIYKRLSEHYKVDRSIYYIIVNFLDYLLDSHK